jgi:hypothetical protein
MAARIAMQVMVVISSTRVKPASREGLVTGGRCPGRSGRRLTPPWLRAGE